MSAEHRPFEPEVALARSGVSAATVATVLLKKGLRNCFIRGARPLSSAAERCVGRAFTLRFIPAREDLFTPETLTSPRSTRAAVEAMAPGSICVAGALGETSAGVLGDILCARMRMRGVTALVTDGAVRDAAGVALTGLPVWSRGVAASPSVNALTFVNWQEPIDCGGVAVFPNDVVLADMDGAVVIPMAMLDAVVDAAVAQEQLEAWVLARVNQGQALPGLYPPDAGNRTLFEAAQKPSGATS